MSDLVWIAFFVGFALGGIVAILIYVPSETGASQ